MDRDLEKQCVLIIDDTPVQLVVLGRILSSQYDVKMAKTGEEGLRLAREHNIDLILLDLYMPDTSGFELLSSLKESEETKDIPVILITGSSSSADEEKGLAGGAVDYIRKPFTESVVKLRVEIHLRLITQMKIIENLSLTDGLTGISNRRSFDITMKSVWNLAKRTKTGIGMLMLDIDKFKNFNDTYGHINGDICLKAVAAIIQSSVKRRSDSVYRWGGEEFAVLLPETDLDGCVFKANVIRENIAATPITFDNETTFVTVSIGAGFIVPAGIDYQDGFAEFSASVDKALYRAKENGRNRVEKILN